jgi:hypothetical protein
MLAATAAIEGQAGEKAPPGFTYDTAPAMLEVSRHKLQIPQSYLFDFVRGKPQQTSVALLAYLPDLSPISEKNVACFVDWTICDKIVYIEISNLLLPPISEQLKRLLQHRRAAIRPARYGLKRYMTREADDQIDTYGRELSGGQYYLVSCVRQPSPLDTCTYQQNLDTSLSLKYAFKRSQLRNWKSIHAGITQLIASFQQG